MRWKFYDPGNNPEAASHADALRRIDEFWNQFATKAPAIEAYFGGTQTWDMPAWFIEQLQCVDPTLRWEFGPALHGGKHRLVITPESKSELRQFTHTLVDRAPQSIGWEFYPYRMPNDYEYALNLARGRTGRDASGLLVNLRLGEHRLIDLTFQAQTGNHNHDLELAFVMTEALLGEEVINKWIGAITVEPKESLSLFRKLFRSNKQQRSYVSIEHLKRSVSALRTSIMDQLPSQPLFAATLPPPAKNAEGQAFVGRVFKIERANLERYADFPTWVDQYVGASRFPEIWEAAHTSTTFASERFSKASEVFCYLKIDGSEGLQVFADRGELEDAVDTALTSAKLGCVIGGGTGRIYSYVTLALVDVPTAVPILRDVLRGAKIHRRTWLLFFDAEYFDEWIGIWDDTPPPPTAKH